LTKKLPKGNRVEDDNDDSTEEKPTEGRSSKTEKPKKERKEKKQKPILEEAEDVKDIQGVDELNEQPMVDELYDMIDELYEQPMVGELKEQPIVENTVESNITYKTPKTKTSKSFNLRRGNRLRTRSIRLTRDEKEGTGDV